MLDKEEFIKSWSTDHYTAVRDYYQSLRETQVKDGVVDDSVYDYDVEVDLMLEESAPAESPAGESRGVERQPEDAVGAPGAADDDEPARPAGGDGDGKKGGLPDTMTRAPAPGKPSMGAGNG